ncbi:heat shock transcription factor 1 [Paragonimus westermani]|uniref:Heat shock transcription factor 1 n=1 Tax=Paragonimus westermani TaxID=34504 RepID=A0A5J4NBJ8_9TREM|nr:heat shock transcription factor 1 [Paragonimus westermani]
MAIDLQEIDFGPPAVPAFLTKLRLLVDDEDTNDLIYWDPSGTSFHICDGNRLAKEILPLFFKHNNLSSFIRQLNMCKHPHIVRFFSDGFRKVNRVDPSIVLKTDTEDMEFRHPFFVRHRQHLMSKIQRKPPNSYSSNFFNGRLFNNIGVGPFVNSTQSPLNQTANPSLGQRPVTSGDFMRLSGVVRTLRVNQEAMAQQMSLIQSENQLLYSELHELQERLEQQSQLIQTLFSFLSAFAKDRRAQNFRFPLKRKALPFASSNVLPTNSRSGLKLNLPQGNDPAFSVLVQNVRVEL